MAQVRKLQSGDKVAKFLINNREAPVDSDFVKQ